MGLVLRLRTQDGQRSAGLVREPIQRSTTPVAGQHACPICGVWHDSLRSEMRSLIPEERSLITNIGTQEENIGTLSPNKGTRGRPASTLTKAERQRLYRQRSKDQPAQD